jgi:hypothetical protein
MPQYFMFVIDENGYHDSTDRHEFKVFVSIDSSRASISVPLDRHAKQASMRGSILADGLQREPFVVGDRKTAENERHADYYGEIQVFITSQSN